MIAFEAFVDILTGHFFKFSSDGIEVDKSCYSHRSFVIHLSASMYAPVLSLRVRHSSYNASPTRQTCVFVLMIAWSFTDNSPIKMAECLQHMVYRIYTKFHEDYRSFSYCFKR